LNSIQDRLSYDLVPYQSLNDALSHIEKKIKFDTNMAMHLISREVRQIHKQARIHYVHVENHIIISLLIPLTANKNPFSYYKIFKHEVTNRNSQVSTILDNQVNYIAIETNSMQFTYLTDMEAQSILAENNYLVGKKLIYSDNRENCLTAIYRNVHSSIKKNCHYNVIPHGSKPTIAKYDDSKFYIRNTPEYNVHCTVNIMSIAQW